MALLRSLLKCGQMVNENILINSRSITVSNIRRNTTVEEKKEEHHTQNVEAKSTEKNEELEKLNKQLCELTEQNAELLDKYKRALADSENLRTRLTKQIAEAKIFGIQSFCKDLLDVADVLSKATETIPKEEINDSNPHLKSLFEGLVMTEAQLKSVFKRHGLEPVNPIDEKFNPNYHEALFQKYTKDSEVKYTNTNVQENATKPPKPPKTLSCDCQVAPQTADYCQDVTSAASTLLKEVEGKDPGTVVIVSKIGYKLHDRVIRPALVGVSK